MLTLDDLVAGEDVFFAATGVTTGALLGACATPEGAVTDSIVMRSRSGTVRRVEAHHAFEKRKRLRPLTGVGFPRSASSRSIRSERRIIDRPRTARPPR